MNRIRVLTLLVTSVALATRLCSAAPPLSIARFVDENVVAIARLDFERYDRIAAGQLVTSLAKEASLDPKAPVVASLFSPIAEMEGTVLAANQLGIKELYAVYRIQDWPQSPPYLIARLPAGIHQKAAASLKMPPPYDSHAVHDEFAFWGCQQDFDQIRKTTSKPRPDLEAALADGNPALLKIALSLPADSRRVFREFPASLPPPLTGLTGSHLGNDLNWLTVALDLPPHPVVRVVANATNPDSAKNLSSGLSKLVASLETRYQLRKLAPNWLEVSKGLTPQQDGERFSVTLDSARTLGMAKTLSPIFSEALGLAARSRSRANLNAIGVAFHIHHDEKMAFPAQALVSSTGTKLLSWRVQILPFLGHMELYKQFRLDESWDSEHNKTLIPKMPNVYSSLSMPPELAAKGLTPYLVPVMEGAVFEGVKARKIEEIVDGTSLTIAVVEVSPSAATIWTKPEDLVVNKDNPYQHLVDNNQTEFLATFCDGRAKPVRKGESPEPLLGLFRVNDGQPKNFP